MRIIFQIAIAILSLVAIISVLRRKREHLLGPLGALFWIIFWVALISIVSLPTTVLDRLSQFIGIGRGVDLVMYISIAVLFFVVFKLYVKIESLKRDMTEIARKKTIDATRKRV